MISYLEYFKPFSRLEGTLGAKIEVQIDLTFFSFDSRHSEVVFSTDQRAYASPASSARANKSYVAQGDYERLGD